MLRLSLLKCVATRVPVIPVATPGENLLTLSPKSAWYAEKNRGDMEMLDGPGTLLHAIDADLRVQSFGTLK